MQKLKKQFEELISTLKDKKANEKNASYDVFWDRMIAHTELLLNKVNYFIEHSEYGKASGK